MSEQPTADDVSHLVGLDVGKLGDPSALAVLERRGWADGRPCVYEGRLLRRWPLGTPYREMRADVARLLRSPALRDPILVIDQTGVGGPVAEEFALEVDCVFRPVTITGGQSVTAKPDGSLNVPKRELAAVLQVLLGARRLLVSSALPEAAALLDELRNFQVRVTQTGYEQHGHREGAHDDLVLAVALAAWVGENRRAVPVPPVDAKYAESVRGVLDSAPEGVFFS